MEEPQELYLKTEYLITKNTARAVVRLAEKVKAHAALADAAYADVGNRCEPFDFRTPIFEMPLDVLLKAGGFTVFATGIYKRNTLFPYGEERAFFVPFAPENVVSLDEANARQVRDLKKETILTQGGGEGVRYEIARWRTKAENAPVIVYTLWADLEKTTFTASTPDDETAFVPHRAQTVMEEIAVAQNGGVRVLAAVNADFFDMFGDCAPSGLCVHKGQLVASGIGTRSFLARLADGTVGIYRVGEVPVSDIAEAVAGKDMLLENGVPCELAPLEPFGETPHPRTAVGVTADGKTLILTVVDGRRPDWSNGATLADLAALLRAAGAEKALNLDGGGSSTFILREGDGFAMKNQPADLQRPTEDLVRPLFDAVLIVKK